MKILIAGVGNVGETLVKELSEEGYDLTVIDTNPKTVERLTECYDIMGMTGNCASMETMKEAGALHADLMIAATGSDEVNMLCSMTVHGINPNIHTIARIRNPEYIEQAYSMRNVFGLSLAFNPEGQTATEIERLLKFPVFLKRDSFAKGRVEIVELRIDKNSKLKDVPLTQLNSIIKCKILVCAVLRDGTCIIPRGDFTLRENDKIFVTAPTDALSTLLKNLGVVSHKTRRVMIIGGGIVSYYLAKALENDHMDITIVEKDPEKCVRLASQLPHAAIIQGDGTDRALLDAEGLSQCDALLALTGMDELNMIISMYGSSVGISRIVTRLDRIDDTKIIDRFSVGSVISPKSLCCNTIVRYVRAMQNQSGAATAIHTIANGQAEAMEFLVDESTLHCGEPLKNVPLKKNILLACINRHGHVEFPSGSSSFQAGDTLVVVSAGTDDILQLNDIFA